MKRITVLLATFLTLPWLAIAGTFQLKPDLQVVLPEIQAPWRVTTEPGAELVGHLAEHVLEEAEARGKDLTAEQARQIALERARQNELFVINPESGAHLLISFSALKPEEEAPSARSVALSAKYAAEGVADEGWTDVSASQSPTEIEGAQSAQWFTIDYSHEGERSRFLGIVGFAHPYWFWFYGNDHLKNPRDRADLEKLMRGIEVRAGQR